MTDEQNYVWVQYEKVSGEVRFFISEGYPEGLDGGEVIIPFPVNMDEVSSYFLKFGKTVLPVEIDWRVMACGPCNETEFYLVDCDDECEKVPYKHFHHAVFFKNFKEYRVEVENFLVKYEVFSKKISGLTRSLDISQKAGFISWAESVALHNEAVRIERNFCSWIKNTSPQNSELLLAQKHLEENQGNLEDIYERYQKITKVIGYVYDNFVQFKEERKQIWQTFLKESFLDKEEERKTREKLQNLKNNGIVFLSAYCNQMDMKKAEEKLNEQDAFFDYELALKKAEYYKAKAEEIKNKHSFK
jgi:hypothetical protein